MRSRHSSFGLWEPDARARECEGPGCPDCARDRWTAAVLVVLAIAWLVLNLVGVGG